MNDFIELGRTFHQLSDEYIDKDKNDAISVAGGLSPHSNAGLDWEKLSAEYRVIILAEAGAGKTYEIQHATKKLKSDGKPAFFLRLEHISTEFESAFEIGNFQEFQIWLDSDKEGWILLDSVDEARLKSSKDFEAAVRKLAFRITSALQRTHIFITSRITAWKPKTDLDFCNNQFPFHDIASNLPRENNEITKKLQPKTLTNDVLNIDKENDGFEVYTINDLSLEQIEIFVTAKGILNDSQFLKEIKEKDAWNFTTRPQDLEELVEFWRENKRVGTHLELMQHSINRKIKERDVDRANTYPLSLDKTKEGVRLLAAACSFMNESTIIIPDVSNEYKGIDAKFILQTWNERECDILLNRPIFDEAIYGTVRFHHRSVREYLTAEWIFEKLKEQASRKQIENLFFREQYSRKVIIPLMKPILAWLVLFDEKILNKVLEIEPEVILDGGDPNHLPVEVRKEIIRSICVKIARGTYNRIADDRIAMQRLASETLVDEIKLLIEYYKDDIWVVSYLLRLVLQGRMCQALPEAKFYALNNEFDGSVRNTAIRIVAIVGSVEDLKEISKSLLLKQKPYDRSTVSVLIENLERDSDTVSWIITAAKNIQANKEYGIDGLSYSLQNFINESDSYTVFQLIRGINELLNEEPTIERADCSISKENGWLLPICLKAAEKLIIDKDSYALDTEILFILRVVPIFEMFSDFDVRSVTHNLPESISQWKELNSKLFWYTVKQKRGILQKKKERNLRYFWQVREFRNYWKFDESDFDTIISEITERKILNDRFVVLSLAFALYKDNGRPKKWLVALKRAVSDNPKLKNELTLFLHPKPQSAETKRVNRLNAQWERRRKEEERKKEVNHFEWIKLLRDNNKSLRDNGLGKGIISNWQSYLYDRILETIRTDSLNRLKGDWKNLIQEYGIEVAESYRDGLIKFWRNYIPELRSEKNMIDGDRSYIKYGLCGIEFEFASGLPQLREEDAELLCRYAFCGWNEFPDWFSDLYKSFPEIILQLTFDEIAWEFNQSESSIYVLGKVCWSGEWLWEDIAPKLLRLLEKEPLNLEIQTFSLKIIQGSKSVSDDSIAEIASRKCGTVTSTKIIANWFATWIGVEPELAIYALTFHLEKLKQRDKKTAQGFAMDVAVGLLGDRRYQLGTRENFKLPKHLKSLLTLMFMYIKAEEDIDRTNQGAYSPGLRDYAQEARNNILYKLKDIPGKETYLTLLELSENHPLQFHRPWMLRLAKERAELDAQPLPWTSEKVREFSRSLESTPSNHRELFDLGVQRLLDLKYQLEEGDDSIASTLKKETAEVGIRKVIASWCRDKAVGRYVVAQEDELADAKRPDCRFLNSNIDAPVPLELKLADNWTGSNLLERLENQLCGDYLRDFHSSSGIFVLVYRGEKKGWDIPGGKKRATFSELVEALQTHWETISYKFPKVEQISVIGIDLTKRDKANREFSIS